MTETERRPTAYTAHPAAELFPLMTGADFDELVADIRDRRQQEAITLYHGQILDGRNRYAACLQLGIEPWFETKDDIDDPIAYAISKNLKRRHLNATQRAIIARDALPLFEKQAKERQRIALLEGNTSRHANTPISTGMSEPANGASKASPSHGRAVDAAAAAAGVSATYITDLKALEKHAPDLNEQVRQGNLTINAAREEMARRRRRREEEEEGIPPLPAPTPMRAPTRRGYQKSAAQKHIDTAEIMEIFSRIRNVVLDADPHRLAELMSSRDEATVYATARDLSEWVTKVRLTRADLTRQTTERT